MQDIISFLQAHDEIRIIDTPLDIELEIPHLAYLEVKKKDSKALLFTRPIHRYKDSNGNDAIKEFDMPVLMNVFGSFKLLELIAIKYNSNSNFKDIESIASYIKSLLNPTPPKGFKGILLKLKDVWLARYALPKAYKGNALCQEIIYKMQSSKVDNYNDADSINENLQMRNITNNNEWIALLDTSPRNDEISSYSQIKETMPSLRGMERKRNDEACSVANPNLQIYNDKEITNTSQLNSINIESKMDCFGSTHRNDLGMANPNLQIHNANTPSLQGEAIHNNTHKTDSINLFDLPILKTWEDDGGRFITMGQVYTQSLSGAKNVGMYRLQVHSKDSLLMHWQIHKDGAHFFHEYKKANKKMPVSIAIGGDPLYIWCGQAPMPPKMFELMLYGVIRGKNPRLIKCITNDLSVPYDCDIVIEGYVDTSEFAPEGRFGDHTGFYTPIEDYPIMRVSAITMRKKPIFAATVVGKPPLEDKYMGYMTERLFLPLLQTSVHGLIDYAMPENGVFHNLILARIKTDYPAQSLQIMHSFFGIGQLSFVKHAIFLSENAPSLHGDYRILVDYILDRVDVKRLITTSGICDVLDHASEEYAISGKLGIDASGEKLEFSFKDSKDLEQRLKGAVKEIDSISIYPHKNPIIICKVVKNGVSIMSYANGIYECIKDYASFIVFIDSNEALDNYYMLIWRIVNSIDVSRDLAIIESVAILDATSKGECDGYMREWPKDTLCTPSVIESLKQKGLLEGIDSNFLEKYGII